MHLFGLAKEKKKSIASQP